MMKPQRRQRLYLVISIVVGVTLAVSLAIYALGQNINLYFTPSQVAQGQAPKNHIIRLGGMVEKGSIHRVANSLQVNFVVTDFQNRIVVSYTGILPTLFRDGQGVVVQGKLTAQDQFNADQVLAKHDEKYMPPEIKQQT